MKWIPLFTVAAFYGGLAWAQQEGDPEAGKLLADQYCSRCHDIGESGAFKQSPPSFAAIAVYWGEDQIWNRIMFPVHTSMPAMWDFLTPESVAHVTAYIMSLEK
ncbi:cytochrome c [Aestuariicoccus sp. MJ-SS9]|uniref:c-type cytochrome n=1 Tax=Aestuariicoccus sp. MJ-SS9 TaxID=3079855 RepID=UPI0029108D88|nr:cytochrome c [Aestuariicoccus sp. MJ-SS9]MDU8912294.1 cytochrome c [Aestuariicoccus sp. MJ-SS9]